ncbi:NAD(P)-binding protein [Wallemia mellicola]|uniref:NAD(P)-binding protein n=1 Tax=Wallemia mellicola TaxID=1708541 RepID=A0AB38MV09_9BASI|nr:NAD(P)-binding protein [Wallemia mellicola]TIC62811.1 NAD(P)-binding protein [Wallemia mellicola]
MACRSTDKAEKARQEVVKKIKNDNSTVEVWKIDLASLSSCREFASKWNANPDNKIDILYLNAGLIAPNASLITSEDGLEMTYACNVLGHLAVIEQLLPSLALSDDPRIIFTGSSGAKMSTLPDHPGSNKRTPLRDAWSIGSYVLNAFNIYTDTKLLLAMVVRELQESFKNHPDEKYRKIFVANYHPGFVKTTISNKDHYGLSSLLSIPVDFLTNRYAITPEVGARPGLYLGSASIEQLPGGEFWDENAEPASLTAQYDNEALRRRLRNLSNIIPPMGYDKGKQAAVMVALFIGRLGDLHVLLSQRSDFLSSYPGDTCLIGGRKEPSDVDVEYTARREAEEEIGLPIDYDCVRYVATLPPHLAGYGLSAVTVWPIVCLITDRALVPMLNEDEVQRIFSHPLESFLSHRPDKLLLRLGHLEDESDAYHWYQAGTVSANTSLRPGETQ